MATAYEIRPDLGLDPAKIPDLSDGATQKKLSPAAIKAFFSIAESWNLRDTDAMALLGGMSSSTYYQLKKKQDSVLSQDELTRASLLIGIFKALNVLFSPKLANQWISRPNSNPMFANAPPLKVLSQRGLPGMLDVRRFLDSRRGGR
jgi:uncharacterized protein (DUF2384 family)